MEDRDHRGVWWNEEDPNETVAGTLSYSPGGGVYLKLMGDLVDSLIERGPAKTIDKILGITEDGTNITLLNCTRDNQSLGTGIRTSTYYCSYLLEGYCFQNQNPAFDRMDISFYGMNKWVGGPTPWLSDDTLKKMGGRGLPDKISIEYDVMDPLRAWCGDTRIQIGTNVQTNSQKHESTEISVRNEFNVIPRRTQVPFETYLDHLSKLERLVSLGVGHPTSPKKIIGKVGISKMKREDVEIYYQVHGDLFNDVDEHPSRMLFRGREIASDFDSIMNQWYDHSTELDEIFNMYFATVFQERAYPQTKLMNLCHGLESYHRKRFSDTYMSPTDYDNVYNDIIEIINGNPSNVYSSLNPSKNNLKDKYGMPRPFVQSLSDGTIKHANKKSLRKRLKEITSSVDRIINDLPHSILGKEKQVADTRNYFAHRTDELKRRARLGADLTRLNWGLQQLIEACLLLEVGIDPSQIKERLGSKYNNKFITEY